MILVGRRVKEVFIPAEYYIELIVGMQLRYKRIYCFSEHGIIKNIDII
jgi:hypothetical protein